MSRCGSMARPARRPGSPNQRTEALGPCIPHESAWSTQCGNVEGHYTLDAKSAGERRARDPHAACDAAGAGNGVTDHPSRARKGKPWARTRDILRATVRALDPTNVNDGEEEPSPRAGPSLQPRQLGTGTHRWEAAVRRRHDRPTSRWTSLPEIRHEGF